MFASVAGAAAIGVIVLLFIGIIAFGAVIIWLAVVVLINVFGEIFAIDLSRLKKILRIPKLLKS